MSRRARERWAARAAYIRSVRIHGTPRHQLDEPGLMRGHTSTAEHCVCNGTHAQGPGPEADCPRCPLLWRYAGAAWRS